MDGQGHPQPLLTQPVATRDDGVARAPLRGHPLVRAARQLLEASDARARPPQRAGRGRDGSRYAELRRQIQAAGLLERRPGWYAFGIVRTLAFVLGAVVFVALTAGSPWVWLGAPLAAFASGQLVLLGHDAAHHAAFASGRANRALGVLCLNLLSGGSCGWWAKSHNEHHARSNDPAHDPDIDYPFFAFSPAQAQAKDTRFAPILARQHVLAFCAMPLVGLNLRVYSLIFLLRRPDRWLELLAMLAYWVAYPAAVIHTLGFGPGLGFIALHQACFGLYVGLITALNHWGMPMPPDSHTLDFVEHQVVTSRNVGGGPLVDLVCGGLNRQVEHHLFPTMPRPSLARAAPLVQAFCRQHGIPYHQRAPLGALREVYASLRGVARQVAAAHA